MDTTIEIKESSLFKSGLKTTPVVDSAATSCARDELSGKWLGVRNQETDPAVLFWTEEMSTFLHKCLRRIKFLSHKQRGAAPAQISSTSQTIPQMSDSDILTINCWVLGDEYDCVFPVKIPRNESVAALRVAIKAEDPTTMKDIAAKNLILYRVSIPPTPKLAQHVARLGLDGLGLGKNPLSKLSEAFDNGLLDGHVHVVVKTSGVWAYNYLSTLHLHVSQFHSCHLVRVSSLRTPHNL